MKMKGSMDYVGVYVCGFLKLYIYIMSKGKVKSEVSTSKKTATFYKKR